MNTHKTEQENFWAGDFGKDYIKRNNDKKIIASNISFFSKIFKHTNNINSIIEFGSNIGLNLLAIQQLLPDINLSSIEINSDAIEYLKKIENLNIYHTSILEFTVDRKRDFVFTKGVLIHINPEELQKTYEILYETSNRYICVCEYYNPTPVGIDYRGVKDKLFKRDFAGELLEKYSDLKLLDYGFVYKKDYNFPQDDVTWFLMEKGN